jgi:hypothetical protein
MAFDVRNGCALALLAQAIQFCNDELSVTFQGTSVTTPSSNATLVRAAIVVILLRGVSLALAQCPPARAVFLV